MPSSHPSLSRVAITGAAGFIGSHLVRFLIANHNSQIIGIDNERSGDWDRVDPACRRVHRSLVDMTFDEMVEALTDVHVLFHLAAEKYNSSQSTPAAVIDTNIVATHRLFLAAATAGVEKIVFTSSLYAYGSTGPDVMAESDVPAPTTMYGMSKIAGENLLRVVQRDHGTAWAVARLFFTYGPDQYADGGYKSVIITNFERMRRGEAPIINGDGTQELDYVYIDDCVAALTALAVSPVNGLIVNVASGQGQSINDLTSLMQEAAGSDQQPVTGPADWTAGTSRVGRNDRIKDTIGWAPRVPIDRGLADVWAWMGAQHV